jgi:ribose transport system substrate-binding protein
LFAGAGARRRRRTAVVTLIRRMSVVAASVLALASFAVVGCGDDDDGGGGGNGGGGGGSDSFAMGFSSPFLTDPFQAVLQKQTIDQAKSAGLETLEPTNANQDAGQQATDVRNLITGGAEGLIVVPTDSKAIIPALDYADREGVPVVAIDLGPEGGKAAMIVRADNYGMGVTACQKMGEELGGQGKVLSLQGDLATINGKDRTDGFKECMSKEFPDVEVIERPTKWQAEQATNAAQTVLTANSDLAGIYMQSDSVMLSGVLNVLKRAGKDAKVGEPGHITLISIDGTPLSLEKIRSGELDGAVSQPLDLYAKYGVDYLRKAVAGETFAKGPTDHDSEIVEFEGNLMDLLPAPLVTKENVDDKNLWGNQAAATAG